MVWSRPQNAEIFDFEILTLTAVRYLRGRMARRSVLWDYEQHARSEGVALPRPLSEAEQDALLSVVPPSEDAAVQLGLLLEALRERLNPKRRQVDIGRASGRPQSWVSKYEHGAVRLDVIQLEEVATEVKVTLSDLDAMLTRR